MEDATPALEDPAFAEASAAARENPSDDAAWDALEDWAAATQRPDDVSVVYRSVLAEVSTADVGAPLAQRALNFHEEWFGEDAPQVIEVLERALVLDPDASDWAFQRLTVVYTGAERWDELFALYTIDWWRRPTTIERPSCSKRPRRPRRISRGARTRPSITCGRSRPCGRTTPRSRPISSASSSAESGGKISSRCGEVVSTTRAPRSRRRRGCGLRRPTSSSSGTRLGRSVRSARCFGRSRRIPVRPWPSSSGWSPTSPSKRDARREALGALRQRYAAEGRATDVVRTLDSALALATDAERVALHREAGQALEAAGKAEEALAHYADAVLLAPSDADGRAKLRAFGEQHGQAARVVAVFAEVADGTEDRGLRTSLRMESSDMLRASGDAAGAVALLEKVAEEPELPNDIALGRSPTPRRTLRSRRGCGSAARRVGAGRGPRAGAPRASQSSRRSSPRRRGAWRSGPRAEGA